MLSTGLKNDVIIQLLRCQIQRFGGIPPGGLSPVNITLKVGKFTGLLRYLVCRVTRLKGIVASFILCTSISPKGKGRFLGARMGF